MFKVQWWNWRCSCGKGGWGATKEMEGGYPVSSGRRTSSFLRLLLIPFCFLFSYFHLSVNLPGGELRRRGAEDELSMRKYLQVAGVDCNLQLAPSVTLCSKCGHISGLSYRDLRDNLSVPFNRRETWSQQRCKASSRTARWACTQEVSSMASLVKAA